MRIPGAARAGTVSFEDPVLRALYGVLRGFGARHPEALESFARRMEERMEMFIPPERARVLADVLLRDPSHCGPFEVGENPTHRFYLVINLLEEFAGLGDGLRETLESELAGTGWAAEWIGRARGFLTAPAEPGGEFLEFAGRGAAPPAIEVRGVGDGVLRALGHGGQWFVRHTFRESGGLEFSGHPWPAEQTLWLKGALTIRIADQMLGAEELEFLLRSRRSEPWSRYLRLNEGELAVGSDPAGALAVIECAAGQRISVVEPGAAVMVRDRPVESATPLFPTDPLSLGGRPVSAKRVLETALAERRQRRCEIRMEDVTLRFPDGTFGLQGITAAMESGDLVAVMGPSGCGKSTLVSLLSGALRQSAGKVEVSCSGGGAPAVALVPQDDVLFPNLSVRENLGFGAELRVEGLSKAERGRAVGRVIGDVGLGGKERLRVGTVVDKVLSGGERKRLNIGLELVGDPDVLLLDEPTSGLSSADAASVADLLRKRADAGTLVMAVIHQPSADVFDGFDKVLVLDVGGTLAFFGTPEGSRTYFGIHVPGVAVRSGGPERIIEGMLGQRATLSGAQKRRNFSPWFWHLRYEAVRRIFEPPLVLPAELAGGGRADRAAVPEPGACRRRTAALTVLRREGLRRLREWRGALAAVGIAVGLALVIGVVARVRGIGHDEYSFAANPSLPAFCFLIVILVEFLALSLSVQELAKDRALRLRERLLRVPGWCWLLGKMPGLMVLVAGLAGLVVLLAGGVIGLKYGRMELWFTLTLAGWTSLALGLFVSALPRMTGRVAVSAIPLLLVPQMVLCGAKPFEFRDLLHLHWPLTPPAAGEPVEAPWISGLMPSRWAYQGAICGLRDDPAVVAVKDLKPLRMTFLRARKLADLWRADPPAFLAEFAGATGRQLSEEQIREEITLLFRAGMLAPGENGEPGEIEEAFGDLMPEGSALRADLEPLRNDVFLDYAAREFAAGDRFVGRDVSPLGKSRLMLVVQGLVLLLAAAAGMSAPALHDRWRRRRPGRTSEH